jgi:hypothetical protein
LDPIENPAACCIGESRDILRGFQALRWSRKVKLALKLDSEVLGGAEKRS